MLKKLVLCLFIFIFFKSILFAYVEKPIVVIIPSYKNKDWYVKNVVSILKQNYSNYRIIYLNDSSPDHTGLYVEHFLKKIHIKYQVISFDAEGEDYFSIADQLKSKIDRSKKFVLVNNKNRCGALENLFRAIYSCDDQEIIVTVDGDDWLYHKNVLKELNEVYSSADIWLTHGTLIHWPGMYTGWCETIPNKIITDQLCRTFKCPSHLRTFYAALFKKIQLKDLLFENKFYPMTWDMAMMYPMIEMCGIDHHVFISEPNYVYNIQNQINDNKVNAELQRKLDVYIRSLKPYESLKNLF